MNVIRFDENNTNNAQILLGKDYETFELNPTDWNKSDYAEQWTHAIKFSLNNRNTSEIFNNYEKITPSGIKQMWIYTIIPEEMTSLFQEEKNDPKDFYITNSFLFVTEKIKLLNDDKSFNLINESYGNYFPIYYLNLNKLARFYLYLSEQVEGIAHWKVTQEDLQDTLAYLTEFIRNNKDN